MVAIAPPSISPGSGDWVVGARRRAAAFVTDLSTGLFAETAQQLAQFLEFFFVFLGGVLLFVQVVNHARGEEDDQLGPLLAIAGGAKQDTHYRNIAQQGHA